MTGLTRAVIGYLAEGKNSPGRTEKLKAITDKAMLHIYKNAVRIGIRKEEASGFVLFVLPGLPKIIDNYRYDGVDFEGYLMAVARRRAPSYHSHLRRSSKNLALGDLLYHRAATERAENEAEEMARALEDPASTPQPKPRTRKAANREARLAGEAGLGYGPDPGEGIAPGGANAPSAGSGKAALGKGPAEEGGLCALGKIARVCRASPIWQKRMLVCLFHILPFLSIGRRALISSVFHLDPDELAKYHSLLSSKVAKRLQQRDRILENMNVGFFRLIGTEMLLNNALGKMNDEFVSRKVKYLSQSKDSLQRKIEKLSSMRSFLAQGELAEIFHLARGTISSHIHYARVLAECALDPKSPKMKTLSRKTQKILASETDCEPPLRGDEPRFSITALLDQMERAAKARPADGRTRPARRSMAKDGPEEAWRKLGQDERRSASQNGSRDAGQNVREGGSRDAGQNVHEGASLDAGQSVREGASLDAGQSVREGASLDAGQNVREGASRDERQDETQTL